MMQGPIESYHGPLLIGAFFNILLFGMTISQTHRYYMTYTKDRLWLKIFVLCLFIVDSVNALSNCIYIYQSLVKHFGDTSFLLSPSWSIITALVTTGVIELTVQLFQAWRMFIFTQNWILSLAVVLLSLVAASGSFITTYKGATINDDFDHLQVYRHWMITWLICSAAADILIATVLVWYLQKFKSGFKPSDAMLNRLILTTIQTGLLTSVVSSLNLGFFLRDNAATHMIFNLVICKLYSNSLISSLNSRGRWRRVDDDALDSHGSGIIFQEFPDAESTQSAQSGAIVPARKEPDSSEPPNRPGTQVTS